LSVASSCEKASLQQRSASFDSPELPATNVRAVADWPDAETEVDRRGEANAARRAARNGSPTLNRSTLAIIRHGDALDIGDPHRMLFSAAANRAEFGSRPLLAQASRAGEGTRTLDIQLGKLALYQLSYARDVVILRALIAIATRELLRTPSTASRKGPAYE
jgi:hypothetical protein